MSKRTAEQPLIGTIRSFPLRTVLTVTTGRLLTERRGPDDNGINALYEILRHLTGEDPMTHTLGRFMDECSPWLFRWYPELAKASTYLNGLEKWLSAAGAGSDEGIRMWISEIKMIVPELQDEYAIGQIPRDDHERKNPIKEFVDRVGPDKKVLLVKHTDDPPTSNLAENPE